MDAAELRLTTAAMPACGPAVAPFGPSAFGPPMPCPGLAKLPWGAVDVPPGLLPGLLPVTLEIPMDSAHAVADAIHKAADESAGLKRGLKR